MLKRNLPNIITLGNLIMGCIGIQFSLSGNIEFASYCIMGCAILDFMDGAVARLLKSFSALGKDLDSLSDAVSFGVLPGFISHHLSMDALENHSDWFPENISWQIVKWSYLVIPVLSILRLAKFNSDDRQKERFIGLPTPANALFWAGLALGISNGMFDLFLSPWTLLIITTIMSLVLVSEIPMFSLKVTKIEWKQIRVPFLFIMVTFPMFFYWGFATLCPLIVLYILTSLALMIKENL